jgi:hypothetical protein
MGFRELPLFNQAMLGKQGWRLLTRPESLCARVLKGKYFPNSSFLLTNRKKNSSETWRSILYGRQALSKGLIKRIGPGDSINLWEDNWLAGTSSLKPVVRLPDVLQEKVCDLFVPGTRQWNEALVRECFCAPEADAILKLKPGTTLEQDLDAWAFEKTGLYSVRSCYRMLKHESIQEEDFLRNEATSAEGHRWWEKLWKLKVPPKVRIFWWRVLHNFLPSKMELKRRHVAKEDHCDSCGAEGESVFHVAISCSVAQRFWKAVREITSFKIPHLHPSTWATDLLLGAVCSQEEAALFICGAWSLWTGRNARTHGRDSWSPTAAARHVASMIEDLLSLSCGTGGNQQRSKGVWKKPEAGWKKVNTDASFLLSSSSGSCGAVIRDEEGNLLMATAKRYNHIPNVLTAEALAARDGLLLALSGNYYAVILELDNLALVNLLQSVAGERSEIAGLWHEIRELSRVFDSFNISFVKREGNVAAHTCAKLLPLSAQACTWTEAFPAALLGIASSDCNPVLV